MAHFIIQRAPIPSLTADGYHALIPRLHAPLEDAQRAARGEGPRGVLEPQDVLPVVQRLVNVGVRLELEALVLPTLDLRSGTQRMANNAVQYTEPEATAHGVQCSTIQLNLRPPGMACSTIHLDLRPQ